MLGKSGVRYNQSVADELTVLLEASAEQVAQRVLGSLLVREFDGQLLVGRIVETEAYDQHDAASHSYRGRTPRTDVMFGPAGHLYVYFTYGMHYCCNIVCGPTGEGAAVLIRALEPLEGHASMGIRRRGMTGKQLTNGPAKLCQALGIDQRLNNHDLHRPPLELIIQPAMSEKQIVVTTRIGISQSVEMPRRYYIRGNNYVS